MPSVGVTGIEFLGAGMTVALSALLVVFFFNGRRILTPNVISLMFGIHLAAQVVPATVFLFLPDKPEAVRYFWACILATPLIPFGAMAANFVNHRSSYDIYYWRAWRDARMGDRLLDDRKFKVFIALLGIFCIGTSVYYINVVPRSPIIGLVTGDLGAVAASQLRLESASGSHGYLISQNTNILMPILFVLVIVNRHKLDGVIFRSLSVCIVVAALVNNAYAGEKTPIAKLFILLLFYYIIAAPPRNSFNLGRSLRDMVRMSQLAIQRRKRLLVIFLVGALMFGYPIFVFMLRPLGQNYPFHVVILQGVLARIFATPALNSYYAFEMYPATREFTHLHDVVKLATLIGWEPINMSFEVALYKANALLFAPPASIATFYAQFGYVGVAVGTFIAGFIFRLAENVFFNVKRVDAVALVSYSILLFGAFRFGWNYFHTILFSEAIVPALILLAVWRFLGGNGRQDEAAAAKRAEGNA